MYARGGTLRDHLRILPTANALSLSAEKLTHSSSFPSYLFFPLAVCSPQILQIIKEGLWPRWVGYPTLVQSTAAMVSCTKWHLGDDRCGWEAKGGSIKER